MTVRKEMPDVANNPLNQPLGTLNWVGMSGIEAPIQIQTPNGAISPLAHIQAYVNLADENRKGIHMSRLYIALDKALESGVLSFEKVRDLLEDFLKTHEGISTQARLIFKFDYHKRRSALLSDNSGWKNYPSIVTATLSDNGEFDVNLKTNVTYSSTCPCSAALSRQLIQEKFLADFGGETTVDMQTVANWLTQQDSINATPHSQRSVAEIEVDLSDASTADFATISVMIEEAEAALSTPVQTAVKREDEQEFARLNAANLMFCEDAARRLKNALDASNVDYAHYWVRVNHMESLHPHDAVAMVGR